MKRRVAILLNTDDLDELFIQLLEGVDSEQTQYLYATSFASVAIRTGEHDLAMRYFALALTSQRIVDSDDPVAISSEHQVSYDDNDLYLDLAIRMTVAAAPEITRLRQRGKLRILDLCCGTGISALPLLGFGDHIEGIDLDVSGVKRAGRSGFFNQLHEGDVIEILGGMSEPFDMIQCMGSVYHFPKMEWLFEHANRLLTPGGLLSFNNWPCPNTAHTLLTREGNLRHCHSERYLNGIASAKQFHACEKSWHVVYGNQPNWFMKYIKPAH
jgi:predicted TPR repeat methyltransferase